MKLRLVALLLLLSAPALGRACSIPVFRYALERWELSQYELTIFFDKTLPSDLETRLKELESGAMLANIKIERIDVTGKMDAYHTKLWDRQGAEKSLPWLSARLPETEASLPDAFSGPLTADNLRKLLDSPARQRLVDRLSKGTTAVFLFLPGADVTANQKAADLLDKELARITKLVQLPELKPEDKLKTNVPLKVEFTTLQLTRDDPAERIFIQGLLHSEEKLDQVRGPIVFPVFGRGRLLCSVHGADLNGDNLRNVVRFLCQECSCQLKELNPGNDLLIAADWPAILAKAGPPAAALSPKEVAPAPAVDSDNKPAPQEPKKTALIEPHAPVAGAHEELGPNRVVVPIVVPPSVPSTGVDDHCETCPISNFVHRHGWLGISVIGAGILVLVTGLWFFFQRK